MSRPGGANASMGGGRPSMGSGGGSGQGSFSKGRANSQQQQRGGHASGTASPRTSMGHQQGQQQQQPPATSAPGSQSSRNASPAPHHTQNSKNATQQRGPTTRPQNSNETSANQAAGIISELKALLSQPVVLTLDGGRQREAGLLWAVEADMGIVALEVPKSALADMGEHSSASNPYPTTAASYPTAMLATVKVAAQGGDASGSRTNFTIIKLNRVQRVESLAAYASSTGSATAAAQALSTAQPTLVDRDINVTAADAREKAATAEALKRASKIGVGVSKLGQDVFDALNKTLPCRWADQHIIVMDEIVISPDKYDAAVIPDLPTSTLQTLVDGGSVEGVPADAKAKATRWQRVAKVLAGERRRIMEKSGA